MKSPKILGAWLLLPAALFSATPEVIPLWANGAPGSEARRNEPEQAQDYWVKNIHNPSITVFLPPKEKATGAAVVIFPGGGHRELVFNAEGVEAAQYLNSIGVAAFAVKYRLAREEGSTYRLDREGRADAQRAMRLVRSHAAEWGVDPKRIGVMGFSAGGEMVSLVVYSPTEGKADAADPIDRVSSRPDFQVVVYPGPTFMPNDGLPANTPPAFFVAAVDDRGPARVIDEMLTKFRYAGVPIEVHLFAHGGHAFNMGLRSKLKTFQHWPDRLADWMADNGILDPDPAHHAEK
jgi:acetyl esterase/lipase